MARLKFQDVLDAFEFVSFGEPFEHTAYVCKETGAIHCHSEYGDNEEELPADIDQEGRYLCIPHKKDLGLGKPLAIAFAEDFLESDLRKVREIFRSPSAYARFKDLLEERGMLERWYEFDAAAQRQALLDWCHDNGVEVDG